MSQIERFKYEWIWRKSMSVGFVHAKNRPLAKHEAVLIFSEGFVIHSSQSQKRMNYYPQFEQGEIYTRKRGKSGNIGQGFRDSHSNYETISNGERYPVSVIDFANADQRSKIHPTQKPVELFEYLIRTYTEPGAIVLDNVAGSGTTAIAAENTGRRWICIERDPGYYNAALARVANCVHPQ